jgi:hypothetical protein
VDLSPAVQGATKGVPDAGGNLFGYVFDSQGTQHVVYRSTNNRLNELYWDSQGWHWVDLSFVAGASDVAGDVSGMSSARKGHFTLSTVVPTIA